MSFNDSKQQGGSHAATTNNTNDQPFIFDRFKDTEVNLPPWVQDLDDRSRVKWDDEDGFFYETPEDLERGHTLVEPVLKSASGCKRVDYDFGPYGILPVALVGNEAWCSLNGAGSIAGIHAMALHGYLPEEIINVRGAPGYLKPDGLRCLADQGIRGTGIRLEALTAHVEIRRRGDPRVLKMLQRAIRDIYNRDWPGTGTEPIPVVELGRLFTNAPEEGQIAQRRFYAPYAGEMRAVLLGTQVWLLAADVAHLTCIDEDVLLQIAGEERTLRIPEEEVHGHWSLAQVHGYIRLDAVEKFSAALAWKLPILEPLRDWIDGDLLDPAKLMQRGTHVSASSLHRMLGSRLALDAWRFQLKFRHGPGLFDVPGIEGVTSDDWRDEEDLDQIPISTALIIAEGEKTFAGVVAARLLRESGYMHRGPIDEPANATLERFMDLVPDHRGFVNLRKVWEFLSPNETFEEWHADGLKCGYASVDSPNSEVVSIRSLWCDSIRRDEFETSPQVA